MSLIHGWKTSLTLPAFLLFTGCASEGGSGSDDAITSSGHGLNAAVADYQAGRYDAAHSKSLSAMREAASDGQAASRDHAAYLAGLSAFRMRQFDEAETRLLTAAQSDDPQTLGRSKALLGLIRIEQNRPAAAAEYLRDAAQLLEGSEAAEARYQASMAYEQAGNPAAARSVASAVPGSPPASTSSSQGPSANSSAIGVFAIQVGAFADLTNAQSAAAEARALASQHRLGDVRIVPRKDSRTRTLYVVQFGEFSSRIEAENARRQLGRLNYIVAPISRG